jgi:hypothetical protein
MDPEEQEDASYFIFNRMTIPIKNNAETTNATPDGLAIAVLRCIDE